MTDDVERRLRRFRVAGPPPGLRAAVVDRGGRRSSGREWLLPAAAAAAAIVLFTLASGERNVWRPVPEDPGRGALVSALTDQLGGDGAARTLAARIADVDFVADVVPEAPVEEH